MLMSLPKFKIGESVWFLTQEDKLTHGEVKLVTIAISSDQCNVYYHIIDTLNSNYVVNESQVIDYTYKIPQPKYTVGDSIKYSFLGVNKIRGITEGVIDRIELVITEDKHVDVTYYTDDDPDYFITEDEILGFSEASFLSKPLKENIGDV